METYDSTERTAGELILFALTAFGLLLAGAGVTVSSAVTAFVGVLLSLLSFWCFSIGSSWET